MDAVVVHESALRKFVDAPQGLVIVAERDRAGTVFDMYYDRSGEKISFDSWQALRNTPTYRQVDSTRLVGTDAGHQRVVTVWFGTNQGPDLDDPQIFGTIVVSYSWGEVTFLDDTERFSTSLAEAAERHAELVAEHGGPAEQ